MRKLTAAAVGAAVLAPAALADGNVGTHTNILARNGAVIHTALVADVHAVRTHALALDGARNRTVARLRLSRDVQKLQLDLRSAHQGLVAARRQVAASAPRQVRASIRSERADVLAANAAVRLAARALRSRA
jgi:hypothetical protein